MPTVKLANTRRLYRMLDNAKMGVLFEKSKRKHKKEHRFLSNAFLEINLVLTNNLKDLTEFV